MRPAPTTAMRTPDGTSPFDTVGPAIYDKGTVFLRTVENIVGREEFEARCATLEQARNRIAELEQRLDHILQNEFQSMLSGKQLLGGRTLGKQGLTRLGLGSDRSDGPFFAMQKVQQNRGEIRIPFGNAGVCAEFGRIQHGFSSNSRNDHQPDLPQGFHLADDLTKPIPLQIGHDQVDSHQIRNKILYHGQGFDAVLGGLYDASG